MDTSDLYDTAVLALKVLDKTVPAGSGIEVNEYYEATRQLRDFIRAADREREENNTRGAHRCNNAENNRKDA